MWGVKKDKIDLDDNSDPEWNIGLQQKNNAKRESKKSDFFRSSDIGDEGASLVAYRRGGDEQGKAKKDAEDARQLALIEALYTKIGNMQSELDRWAEKHMLRKDGFDDSIETVTKLKLEVKDLRYKYEKEVENRLMTDWENTGLEEGFDK